MPNVAMYRHISYANANLATKVTERNFVQMLMSAQIQMLVELMPIVSIYLEIIRAIVRRVTKAIHSTAA